MPKEAGEREREKNGPNLPKLHENYNPTDPGRICLGKKRWKSTIVIFLNYIRCGITLMEARL